MTQIRQYLIVRGMNLKSYVSQRYGLASEIAKSLGVTPVTVYEWVHAKKRVPAERCPEIERLTEGAVTCEELRPDLADQWAYLRNTPAPALPPGDTESTVFPTTQIQEAA